MLSAIIVDDEQAGREVLNNMLQMFEDQVEVCCLCSNIQEAVEAIERYRPDVVFLDVRLRDETGFELLQQLQQINFEIVFTTAFAEYALQAIKFAAVDYLLKPIHIDDLRAAVAKIQAQRKPLLHQQLDQLLQYLKPVKRENARIALPVSDGLTFIKITDILYCKASGNYTEIFVKSGEKYLVSRSLGEYEALLTPFNFFRIHHNSLVQVDCIRSYFRGEGGYVVMSDNTSLDVSRRKRDAFLERIGRR